MENNNKPILNKLVYRFKICETCDWRYSNLDKVHDKHCSRFISFPGNNCSQYEKEEK